RLRKYTNRQLSAASPPDTDESTPDKKKRGRKHNVIDDNVFPSEPVTPEELKPASIPPFSNTTRGRVRAC
ncbi:MAG: hypothetical protein ACKPKO_26915, partial [Candidatus Fonsibacter sp.]